MIQHANRIAHWAVHVASVCLLIFGTPLVWPQDMHPFAAQWGRFVGAADHSELNAPLTASDEIAVRGSHFMRIGPDLQAGTADDSRVRLFGVNLAYEAAFPSFEQAREVAATLRSMGVNAVRLHHLDSLPTDQPDVFRSTLTTGPYPTLHAGAVARLRHFLVALQKEGIYVNLNLMVGYLFRPQMDDIPALDASGTPPGHASPVHSFHPRLIKLQQEHAHRLISALQLKGNPGLAQVEIINESSLASAWFHWKREYWNEQVAGPYAAELNHQWQLWVQKRHGSWEQACKVWKTCAAENRAMPTPSEADALQHGLTAEYLLKLKSWITTWWTRIRYAGKVSPRKGLDGTLHPKVADALTFIAETDRQFLNALKQTVRSATRPNLPVAGTQINFGAPLSFLSQAQMDYLDAHYYLDHPTFPGTNWSDTDWYIRNDSMAHMGLDSLLALAFYRDPQRPFVVSEFNQPHPNAHGYEILPLMATMAAQQDWDGIYFFDYADRYGAVAGPRNFNLQGDWTKSSVIGLSARIFRMASVPTLSHSHPAPADPSEWLGAAARDRRPDNWERHLTLLRQVPLTHALSTRVGYNTDPSTPLGRSHRLSLTHLPDERVIQITAPLVKGVFGEAHPGQPLQAGNTSLETTATVPGHSRAMLMHSLDGKHLGESRHMLIALPALVSGSRPGQTPHQPQRLVPYKADRSKWTLEPDAGTSSLASASRRSSAPLWIEKEPVRLSFEHVSSQLTVFPLDPNGKRLKPLDPRRIGHSGTRWSLELNQTPDATALWYEVLSH